MRSDEWLKLKYTGEFFSGDLLELKTKTKKLIGEIQKKQLKIITVAGTNGKGQTCFDLFHLLSHSGSKVALWTSPHIKSVVERFAYNGNKILDQELVRLFEQVECKFAQDKLSYYEFLFVAFCTWIKDLDLDYLVLEVGLGGRLDAVNLFDAEVVLIPSISRDHQEFLGTSFQQILQEKLAVCRPSSQLFTTFTLQWLRQLTQSFCQQTGTRYLDLIEEGKVDPQQSFFTRNRHLAIHAFLFLKGQAALEEKLVLSLATSTAGHGRFEEINFREGKITLIGSHNIDGHRKLVDHYKKRYSCQEPFDAVLLTFSRRSAEEVRWILQLYLSEEDKLFKKIYLTCFDHPKALAESVLKEIFSELNLRPEQKSRIEFVADWKEIFNSQSSIPKTVLVTGSYYFLAELEPFLRQP